MKDRTVWVNRGLGWVRISFMELSKGDNFKMYEPNGDEVVDMNGNCIFYSTSEPYKNEYGEWQIDTLESNS